MERHLILVVEERTRRIRAFRWGSASVCDKRVEQLKKGISLMAIEAQLPSLLNRLKFLEVSQTLVVRVKPQP